MVSTEVIRHPHQVRVHATLMQLARKIMAELFVTIILKNTIASRSGFISLLEK